LKDKLQKQFASDVCGLTFDGDSCFSAIHHDFYRARIQQMRDNMPSFPLLIRDPGHPPIISNPLHLLKRIRCRWVSRNLSMGSGQELVFFSTDRIRKVGFLSPVVFLESQASQMHDTLPIQLFSPLIFSILLRNNICPEFAMTPWRLLTGALTLSGISTRTRVDPLEARFWFLSFYWCFQSDFGDPKGVIAKITAGREVSLYRTTQLSDALNTFVALITIVRRSRLSLCPNRSVNNPLEHAFGKARTRCRDVNTMAKTIGAFTADVLSHAVKSCLDLVTVPYRRISFGADCGPFSRVEHSLFERPQKEIGASLFRRTGIDLRQLDFGLDSTSDLDLEA
jgi:hypothetical protein